MICSGRGNLLMDYNINIMKEYFENIYAMIFCGYKKSDGESGAHLRAAATISFLYIVLPLMELFFIYSEFIDNTYYLLFESMLPNRNRLHGMIIGVLIHGPFIYWMEQHYKPKIQEITKRWKNNDSKQLRRKTRWIFWTFFVFILTIFFLNAHRKQWMPLIGIYPLV